MDIPPAYLNLGFIHLSLPNLFLILGMIVLFLVALVVPFPGEGGRQER